MSKTRKILLNAGRIVIPVLVAGVAAFYSANQDVITPPKPLAVADSQIFTEAKLADATGQAAKPESPVEINHSVVPGDKMPDGTIYAGISPDTGKPMYTAPTDAPLTMTFIETADYAKKLNREKYFGRDDWRVPTKAELNMLFNNRAAVGGFNSSGSDPSGWYWSATPTLWLAWGQRFSDGFQGYGYKGGRSSLRLVR